jgi:hypothetical protein
MDSLMFANYKRVVNAISDSNPRAKVTSGKIQSAGFIIRCRFDNEQDAHSFSLSWSDALRGVSFLTDGSKVSIYAGDINP